MKTIAAQRRVKVPAAVAGWDPSRQERDAAAGYSEGL